MIKTENLVKRFDETEALSGVCLHAPKGSVYGLIGPNGAGKSTIIKHLTGIYRPDSGTVKIDGCPVYENPEIKQRMCYIPDDVYYFVSASTKDLKSYYKGMYKSFDCERYEKLRGAFEINENRPVRLLSRGMQKQSAFWLALSAKPDVLILDEPVDGLDPVMRRTIWNLILQDVSEREMTVLVSSHNLRELEDVCDYVGVIDHGKMMLEHSLSSLQDNIVKLQIVCDNEPDFAPMQVLHSSETGRIKTLIIKGSANEVGERAKAASPVFYDILPISLEEIFIYELGGADYAKNIIL